MSPMNNVFFLKVQSEYKRCVKKAEWLPERFRKWYTSPRGSSLLSRNQTHSSAVGGGGVSVQFAVVLNSHRAVPNMVFTIHLYLSDGAMNVHSKNNARYLAHIKKIL